MPFIKPANSDAKDSSLRLPEVQDALKLGESFAENKGAFDVGVFVPVQAEFVLAFLRLLRYNAEDNSPKVAVQAQKAEQEKVDFQHLQHCFRMGDWWFAEEHREERHSYEADE